MTFSQIQTKFLRAKLKRRYVKTRDANGETLSYIEGWHAISEANRIFGFEHWDRQTLVPQCHWTLHQSGQVLCFYSTKVRISVRAGASLTVREGLGTGVGRSHQAEIAHDMAIKAAETDATKRALATFGNAFGLALYDPTKSQVSRLGRNKSKFVINDFDGGETTFSDPEAFAMQVLQKIDDLKTIDDLYGFWALNIPSFKLLDQNAALRAKELARRIIISLKDKARQISHESILAKGQFPEGVEEPQVGTFLVPKEKRIRDREHLRFVATQACLICGRRPTQAHHLRFAQLRAMALKVSDEYTVPLCVTHHDQLHRAGDERAFWTLNGIENPLEHAAKFWELSHGRGTVSQSFEADAEQEFGDPSCGKGSKQG